MNVIRFKLYFLEMQISRDIKNRNIWISQKNYLTSIISLAIEAVEEVSAGMQKIHTNDNLADVMAKSINVEKFYLV
jgi:hypothetical protein